MKTEIIIDKNDTENEFALVKSQLDNILSLALFLIAVNEKDYKSIEEILKEETLDLNGNYMLGLERRRMDEYEILINGEYNRDEDDNRKVWQY